MVMNVPYIPNFIVVHLGPPLSNAENVVVSFVDYIKNVASSEIYPTWEESAIIANILAQISFTLNRVYLEHYRSLGFNFTITNSTVYDQAFTPGRNIFANIARIVDYIFNSYIRREGFIEPLAAKYCNGTTVTCEGLSQWGSQTLALQGYNSVQILKYYYGDDIELVKNAPVRDPLQSYPGYPVDFGDSGEPVELIQTALNRIAMNYPNIPKIPNIDGIFGPSTERAVKAFQRIFNLLADGIVGRSTWYKLVSIYSGVKRLGELDSEGHLLLGSSLDFPYPLSVGTESDKVTILQFWLSVLSEFYENIPFVEVTGKFGKETEDAVLAFQKQANLPQTGIVDQATWNQLYRDYSGVTHSTLMNQSQHIYPIVPFSGQNLQIGSTNSNQITNLQRYLNLIGQVFLEIQQVPIDGIFGPQTAVAVKEYQDKFLLPVTGIVDENTWLSITNTYKNLTSAVSTTKE